MNYSTGTLYVFVEKGSENRVARTADIRELKKFQQSDWIATGATVKINDVEYKIEHFVIELMKDCSNLFQPENDGFDFGQPAYYSVHQRIYLTRS